MSKTIRLYGWPNSPFTAKVRGFLRHKNLPFDEITPTAWQFRKKIKKKIGRYMIPVAQHPDLGLLQDSYEIITRLDRYHNGEVHGRQKFHCGVHHSFIPHSPKQRFVCKLLEAFADIWFIPTALHTRWNTTKENSVHMKKEFGRLALPGYPTFAQKYAGERIGDAMAAYLPIFGVDEVTKPGFEEFIQYLLGALEKHLSKSNYLFGGRPSLADFAIMGPLYAHTWRDPHSGWREIVERHSHVTEWMHKTHGEGEQGYIPCEFSEQSSTWIPDDEIPETLLPLMRPVVKDFLPYINQCVSKINEYCSHNDDLRVPRALGWMDFSMFGHRGTRKIVTFDQWKIQNVLLTMKRKESERDEICTFLNSIDAPETLLNVEVQNPFIMFDYKLLKK